MYKLLKCRGLLSRVSAFLMIYLIPALALATLNIKIVENFNLKGANHRTVSLNIQKLRHVLMNKRPSFFKKEDVWLELPTEEGTLKSFLLFPNHTMSEGLQQKFPQIKTFDGRSASGDLVKIDLSETNFHAMIFTPGKETFFIDPDSSKNKNLYRMYQGRDIKPRKRMTCEVNPMLSSTPPFPRNQLTPFTNCALKKYRLALAATYSYTQFSGGTKISALAAEVTTVNRMNGIYELDLGVTFEIIPNNAEIICDYTPCPSSPPGPAGVVPYTSGNTNKLLLENQNNLDIIIGSNHYDVGHVVDASNSSNGLATLRSACNDDIKARGVTIGKDPKGDLFDVDYLSHEIGHQFGGEHTQNNDCYANPETSVEPGSGSTIMGYPGICPPNVQNFSSPYFHGINLEEIGIFTREVATCSVNTPIGSAPTIESSNAQGTLPIKTPFALTVRASTEASLAILTYDWEQMDPQFTPQPPESDSPNGPNFRSFEPTLSPTRYFPKLLSLANNGPFTWEVLTSVSRPMSFRVSIRNNTEGGSCNAYQDYKVNFDKEAGPFRVTHPKDALWPIGSKQLVRWQVANTDKGLVNEKFVDIMLSTDGGAHYSVMLAKKVANTGSNLITVPNVKTTLARIMVRAARETFFNISSSNFIIDKTVPVLTKAVRNPLNLSVAYIYYTGIDGIWEKGVFTLNGVQNAHLRLDEKNNRFIVSNIHSGRIISNVSISISTNGLQGTTNAISIPSVLG